MSAAVILACLAVGLMVLAVIVAARGRGRGELFFTGSAREEPTRSDVPYVGTIPFGPWGAQPWGESASPPRRCPQ